MVVVTHDPRLSPFGDRIAEMENGGIAPGPSETRFSLIFNRIEPFVISNRSLSGENTERIAIRVLQASIQPTHALSQASSSKHASHKCET